MWSIIEGLRYFILASSKHSTWDHNRQRERCMLHNSNKGTWVSYTFEPFLFIHSLQHVTAWIIRFINHSRQCYVNSHNLTVVELNTAEKYWIHIIQEDHFSVDIAMLKANHSLDNNSSLLSLCSFIGLLWVGGRESNSDLTYQRMHPLIQGKHTITKLIIHLEHVHMLHAGLTSVFHSI